MFLPWSTFTLSIILAIFQFLLAGAFGAVLSIYSRFGGEHANSIRWSRHGGYLEMISCLINSRKNKSNSVLLAMVAMIIASLVVSLADKGVTIFINPSVRFVMHDASARILVITKQFATNYYADTLFSGWSTSIPAGRNITDALVSLINNTKNIPGLNEQRLYIPIGTAYKIWCMNLNFDFIIGLQHKRLRSGACADIGFKVDGIDQDINVENTSIVNTTENRWSISISGPTKSQSLFRAQVGLRWDGKLALPGMCFVSDGNLMRITDGLQSESVKSPRTFVSKYNDLNGKAGVISMTSMGFRAAEHGPVENSFQKATVDIVDKDELFQDMEAALIKSDSISVGNSTILFEVRITDSNIDILACSISIFTRTPGENDYTIYCIYYNINTFVLESVLDLEISGAMQHTSEQHSNFSNISALMMVEHLHVINATIIPRSCSGLRNATAEASQYMASLGQTFYADPIASTIAIIFNVIDHEKGFDIPPWLLICMPVIMIVCLVLWACTDHYLDKRYTGSLYKVISLHIALKIHSSAPVLMRSKIIPLEFEGTPIFLEEDMYEMEAENSTTALATIK